MEMDDIPVVMEDALVDDASIPGLGLREMPSSQDSSPIAYSPPSSPPPPAPRSPPSMDVDDLVLGVSRPTISHVPQHASSRSAGSLSPPLGSDGVFPTGTMSPVGLPPSSGAATAPQRRRELSPDKKEEQQRRIERMKAGLLGRSSPAATAGFEAATPMEESERIRLLMKEREKLEKRVRSHVEHAEKMKETYHQLSDLYNKVRGDFTVLQRKDKKLQEMYNKMRDDFSGANKKLKDQDALIKEKLDKEIDIRANHEIALETIIQEHKKEVDEWRDKCGKAEMDASRAQEELEARKKQTAEREATLLNQLESLRRADAEKDSMVRTLEADLASLTRTLSEKERFTNSLLSQAEEKFRAELANLRNALRSAQEELENARNAALDESSRRTVEMEKLAAQGVEHEMKSLRLAEEVERLRQQVAANVERSRSSSIAEPGTQAKASPNDESHMTRSYGRAKSYDPIMQQLKSDKESLEAKLKQQQWVHEKKTKDIMAESLRLKSENEDLARSINDMRAELVSSTEGRDAEIANLRRELNQLKKSTEDVSSKVVRNPSSSEALSDEVRKERDRLRRQLDDVTVSLQSQKRQFESEVIRLKSELENTRDNSSVVEELIETKLKLAVLEDEKMALSQALRGEGGDGSKGSRRTPSRKSVKNLVVY